MARYLDPKYDLPFKKVFGEHKPLLISFLNALLPLLPEGREIVAVEYLSPEQVPRTSLSKNSIVDVKCVDSHRRHFIVEMQLEWNTLFARRLVFNASKTYVSQMDKEKETDPALPLVEAQTVYTLAIVNATLPRHPKAEEEPKWYHHYRISEKSNPDEVLEGLEFVLVELPKFKPETWSQTDKRMAVLWLRFLKEIARYETPPEELLEAEEIKLAIAICEEGAYTKAELAIYDRDIDQARSDASYAAMERKLAEKDAVITEKDAVITETAAALARALAELAALKNNG
ncbi:MAG: Rpn family recombination-promoting nuclease/putative transposase [Prevotellaceae bacterium]|jgi:predicted transposase/invertase (TIGR01784 family)|nr:Rpn family recombination-promoting nuclease/putative transposase [Prevotellaceae bacterium]